PPRQGHGGCDRLLTGATSQPRGRQSRLLTLPVRPAARTIREIWLRSSSGGSSPSVLSGAASASRPSRPPLAPASGRLRAPRRSSIDSTWLFTVLVARCRRAAIIRLEQPAETSAMTSCSREDSRIHKAPSPDGVLASF